MYLRLYRPWAALRAAAASPGAAPDGGGQASPAASAAALARGHWSVLAASPLANRQVPVQAWTGRELLQIGGWGGNGGPGEGTAFNPADGSPGRWQRITPAPVPVGTLAASMYHMTYDRCPARYRTRWTGAVADHVFVSDRALPDAAFARPDPG